MNNELISLATGVIEYKDNSLPILISPEGDRYTCHAIIDSFWDSTWSWYVFGYISELCNLKEGNVVLHGYISGVQNRIGTFDLGNLVEMYSSIITDTNRMKTHRLPDKWNWE